MILKKMLSKNEKMWESFPQGGGILFPHKNTYSLGIIPTQTNHKSGSNDNRSGSNDNGSRNNNNGPISNENGFGYNDKIQ